MPEEKKPPCRFFEHCRQASDRCDPAKCIYPSLNNFPGTCSYCNQAKGVKPTGNPNKPFVCLGCIKTHKLSFPEFVKQELPLPV